MKIHLISSTRVLSSFSSVLHPLITTHLQFISGIKSCRNSCSGFVIVTFCWCNLEFLSLLFFFKDFSLLHCIWLWTCSVHTCLFALVMLIFSCNLPHILRKWFVSCIIVLVHKTTQYTVRKPPQLNRSGYKSFHCALWGALKNLFAH